MTHISEIPAGTLVKQAHAGVKIIADQFPEAAAILREAITRLDVLREVHQLAKQEAQPVIPEQQQPIAYIFKHPAGRLFWSLTDESNKWQADVIPVYAEPHELKIPPAIEPDYEVIKGILSTANPDEYACCVAADMWNACRAEMLKAQPVSEPYKLPSGWMLVPIEPTENMIIDGFESEPDKTFSKPEVWEEYAAMSGCKQAAHRAKLCWAAMLAAAPTQQKGE